MKIKCIACYPKVFQAYTDDYGNKVRTIAGILPEGDPQITELHAIMDQMKADAFPKGDSKGKERRFTPYDKQPGYMIINLGVAENKVLHVADTKGAPVGPNDLFAGSIVYLDVNPYTFPGHGGGVTVGLNAVFCTGKEGELGRLGGAPSLEALLEGFDEEDEDSAPVKKAPAKKAPAKKALALTQAAIDEGYDESSFEGWTEEEKKESGYYA